MKRKYDETIKQHYKDVAEKSGLSPTSTMSDMVTRSLETEAIIRFTGEALEARRAAGLKGKAVIADSGCGNGYTLSQLAARFPGQQFVGIEKSDDLRALAVSRFKGNASVKIIAGDIREKGFAGGFTPDILVCQRVLINLLDLKDQKAALKNIAGAVRAGGRLLFIECFNSPLARLNEARDEFGFEAIPPAHHNLYLPDDFFDIPGLKPLNGAGAATPPNFLSTHYYVTRVLHSAFTPAGKPFKRNSEFVQFFTQALPPAVGDYSPLKLHTFVRSK